MEPGTLGAKTFPFGLAGAVQGTTAGSRTLQPWLVGLTAVVVFLCIVVVLMIINRVWCSKKRRWDPCLTGHMPHEPLLGPILHGAELPRTDSEGGRDLEEENGSFPVCKALARDPGELAPVCC
uniref:Uncharacterized protein n=1 Tax=Gopherus agassizii TaxID=38772 RepID=A0A452IDU3_9SAUR